MKIFKLHIEGMTTFFMTKREARRFNRAHDEPQAIEELSKAEVVALLNAREQHECCDDCMTMGCPTSSDYQHKRALALLSSHPSAPLEK